ncbi:helix-turn-helix domain-containing protein [Fusobacterium sp. IOR10]|uniref:helix-turn-helix domain-containing protein n=1 Tax=Fusobacterium sp. IOR10 TaxID=2665157 RepID=UPI0013CFBC5E|nr:helix-turn-helix domain-containing protein [Fusobacterium sp. IOR10]
MRDMRERNWFWIENDLIDRTDINIYEKMLYICLARHSYGKNYAFPGLDTLCNELGIKDKRTVTKYTKNLQKKGFISIEKRKGMANKYYLNNIEKVDTFDVGTSHVGSDISCTGVDTSHAGSSDMGCTSNKTLIRNTNKTTTSTKIEEDKKESSSYEFLNNKNLDKITINLINKNIHELKEKTFNEIYNQIKKQNTSGKFKSFDAVLYQALKGEWIIDSKIEKQIDVTKASKSIANYCLSYLDVNWNKQQIYELLKTSANTTEIFEGAKKIIDGYFEKGVAC